MYYDGNEDYFDDEYTEEEYNDIDEGFSSYQDYINYKYY